jgi:dTDP-4-dehydrorhamnose 3,5-epimerase
MLMSLEIHEEVSHIPGLKVVSRPVFSDNRGKNCVLYTNNLGINFIQDNVSISKRGVLRGLHGDDITTKLVTCLYGYIYFVVVDVRPYNYGKSQGWYLGSNSEISILLPPGVANGHYVLSETAMFHYKLDSPYNRDRQFTYRYDEFDINWPPEVKHELILSERDQAQQEKE